MHGRLSNIPDLAAAAGERGVQLIEVRDPPRNIGRDRPQAAASGCSPSARIALGEI
jgi:uncharacterized NAD-dependent epimerase/dehydratase family protein